MSHLPDLQTSAVSSAWLERYTDIAGVAFRVGWTDGEKRIFVRFSQQFAQYTEQYLEVIIRDMPTVNLTRQSGPFVLCTIYALLCMYLIGHH
jgi:hypothetical protein